MRKIIVLILTWEARLIVRKYKPFVVAVTGSVGKTSAKDAIYAVLKNRGKYVRKSEKSLNSEIGLPLTVIGAPNAWHDALQWGRNAIQGLKLIVRRNEYPDCLILEIGADHPGDIKRVARWLKPDIAVLTKVSRTPVHVEFFKSPEQLFEEKAALARAVKKGGTAVLFADYDADGAKMAALAAELKTKGVSVITYGTTDEAQVRGYDYEIDRDWDSHFKVTCKSVESFDTPATALETNVQGQETVARGASSREVNVHEISFKNPLGRTGMYPLLAASAVGAVRGMPMPDIIQGLNGYQAPKGRMNVIQGVNGSVLIDDSYNSSPDAALSALLTLKELKCAGKKIAVLGDMMELGKYSAEEHHRLGREAAPILLDGNGSMKPGMLITVGQRSRATASEAMKNGMSAENVRSFDSSNEAAAFAPSIAEPGDIVLVKGSQSVRLERVVKALLQEPGKAAELLVRQEPEWLEKK